MKVTGTVKNMQDAADELFDAYKLEAQALGYQVDVDGIVGKNADTGEDAPLEQKTIAWTEVTTPDPELEDTKEDYITIDELERLGGRKTLAGIKAKYSLVNTTKKVVAKP